VVLPQAYPRYKGKGQYDSLTYPQAGFSVTHDHRVCLSKIGSIKVKLHRKIKGAIKTCTIKREGYAWYIIFACEVEAEHLSVSYEDVGIDLGVMRLATLSNGEAIEHPRYLRKAEKKLQVAQQALSRKKRGSNRRKKAVKTVARLHRKVRNQRQDFLHKQSRALVNRYQVIVFEELEAAHLTKRPKPKQDENGRYLPNGASAKAGLNKSILDAGWGQFVQYTQYKAESAGRTVLLVNPHYTSQVCSGCGTVKKKELSERWHSCECGTELDRDHNAAINILRLGRSRQAAQAS
jgi:putative transposase